MENRKGQKAALIVSLVCLVIAAALLAIMTLVGTIPTDVLSNGYHFGTVASLKEFIASFVPDPGLLGMGRTWWPDNQSVGGYIGVACTITTGVLSLIGIIYCAKKKIGVAAPILWMFAGLYNSYLFSFVVNALLRQSMYRSASFWLYAIMILVFASWLLATLTIAERAINAKKVAEPVAEPISEESVRKVISEEIEKHEENHPQPVVEARVEEMSGDAVKAHEQEKHTDKDGKPIVMAKNAKSAAPAPKKPRNRGVQGEGKYEVFPEAGVFKFRLKANNGQILVVSNSYVTKDGAMNGIDTFRKNVEIGIHKVITDKNGKGQFRIFTPNDSRLIVAGEIYPDAAGAERALNSTLHFYGTKRVFELDEIPEKEIREWKIELVEINPLENGKVEVDHADEDETKWIARLVASNGEILFITPTYASKSGLLAGVDGIREKILAGSISVVCDKQKRFQFKVFSDNGMVMVLGETYPSKDAAISAANSARNFLAGGAVIVDKTKTEEEVEK